jgi:hypothetical protein
MIQDIDQATAQAIAQLTAYAPAVLADNAARYPIVLFVNLVGAVVFSGVTWMLATRAVIAFKSYETEGRGFILCGASLIVSLAAFFYSVEFLSLLSYAGHPNIWALKDLVASATH